MIAVNSSHFIIVARVDCTEYLKVHNLKIISHFSIGETVYKINKYMINLDTSIQHSVQYLLIITCNYVPSVLAPLSAVSQFQHLSPAVEHL